MTLAPTLLSVMLVVAPHAKFARPKDAETLEQRHARYISIAADINKAVEIEGPLFPGPYGKMRTAFLMMAVAKAESEGFQYAVARGTQRGDHGRSWCYGQINIGKGHVHVGDEEMRSWTGQDLIDDPVKCFRAQHRVLKLSMGVCRSLPERSALSAYTSGKCSTTETTAQTYWDNAGVFFSMALQKERAEKKRKTQRSS